MGLLLLLPPLLVSTFVLYWALEYARQDKVARSLGCESAPVFRAWDVLGIQNFKIEMGGMKSHRLSQAFLSRKREMTAKLGHECKTFRIKYPPGETWYYTFDPKNLQAILATQFRDFQQPAARIGAFEPLLGLANGSKWEHSRALLRPQFMREQIADLDLFERHLQDMLRIIPKASGHDGWTEILNMQPMLERFTMDIATEFLFGESVHSQRDNSSDTSALVTKKEMRQFVEAFFAAEKTTAMSMICGDFFWIMHDRKFKNQCKVVHNFVDTYVQRRLESKIGTSKYHVLDAIVADVKDPYDLRSQLLNVLLAGSDTISGTLGFLIASLAQHPRVLTKLRQSILNDFGSPDQFKEITLSSLKNCAYLQWFLKEVLRLYPAVPVNFREAVRDTTLPTGGGPDGTAPVFVPKGYLVAWELWTMHSDPDFWGADADEFKPERWEGRKLGFDYLPFNAGPRVCIGQQFALTEIAYVTVRLLQKFEAIDGSALPQGTRFPCEWKLVDKLAGGVNVRLRYSN